MNKNSEILEQLVSEDFGLSTKEGSRWGKGDEHDSLVLDKERGLFYWNSKDIAGDPMEYLTKIRGMSFIDARNYLKNFQYSGTHVYTIKHGKEDVTVYPKLVDTFYELGLKNRDYFYRRGLTDATIDRFQLGWYNEWSCVPFFEDGTFRNFQLRADTPVKRIKGYYSGIGPLLFNSDILKLTDEIFYTEGPIDAMILIQNGIPAISSNCGGGYNPEWFSKFVRQNKIYFVFDNDEAGVKEAGKLAKFFGMYRSKIYTFDKFEEKTYDPVDFFRDGHTKDELLELVYKESKYVFE